MLPDQSWNPAMLQIGYFKERVTSPPLFLGYCFNADFRPARMVSSFRFREESPFFSDTSPLWFPSHRRSSSPPSTSPFSTTLIFSTRSPGAEPMTVGEPRPTGLISQSRGQVRPNNTGTFFSHSRSPEWSFPFLVKRLTFLPPRNHEG